MIIKGFSKHWNGLYFDHVIKTDPQIREFDPRKFHTHEDRYEMYYVHTGSITQITQDRHYKLTPRSLVLVKPGTPHIITVDSNATYEHYVIVFNPDILGIDNMRYWPDNEVLDCQKKPVITELFKKLDYYHTLIPNDELKDVVCLLIKEILYNIGYQEPGKDTAYTDSIHPLIARALAEINTNLFPITSIDQLAEKLFVTRGYLYRVFKRELNTTPLKYITEKRLDAAKSLLLRGASPTQVYSQCGFSDYTTFYRNYVKAFGQPPSKE